MTPPAPTTPPPADDPQGSLGAVLIGGAILLIAGLFIFWPASETASPGGGGAGGNKAGAAAQQANSAAEDGRSGGGLAQGIEARDVDPARGQQRSEARVTPGLLAPTRGMAPVPPPTPERTSFASNAEELAYFEKKLEDARKDLDMRATFLERMRKIEAQGKSAAEDERNAARAKIVQKNYDSARLRVEELEKKVKALRERKPI